MSCQICACVLSWLQEEEEINYNDVCDDLQLRIIGLYSHASQLAQDMYWYWFDPGGRGVLAGVAEELQL